MTRKFLSIVMAFFLGLVSKEIFAQDPGFSQFYSNPLYLNPAFAGSVECGRLVFNYRNQWPEISNGFVTYSASYDQNLESINSGFGLSFMSDDAGQGVFRKTFINGFYAYQVQLSNSLSLRMGLGATYLQRKLDASKLVFMDMYDPANKFGPSTKQTNEDFSQYSDVGVVDFSFGAVFANEDKFFGGFAVHHLAEPSVQMINVDGSAKLPRKYSVHGGLNMNLSGGGLGNIYDQDLVLQPNILYQQQGDFKQLNFGAYLSQSFLAFGSWFRWNFNNPDALVLLVGVKHKGLRFGYSYDLTLSKLGAKSGGAHEISLAADFCLFKEQARRRIKAIKSPRF
ncbi:MAG: type IX secretion system membrane protein PorP/SprF [Bacteroidales bacterium]